VAIDFYARPGLNIEVYGARTVDLLVVWGDIDFFHELSLASGGPVLELGCGTGRLVLPLAIEGVEITGLDLAPAMLAEAQRKLARESEEVQSRVRLVQGDMTDFDLGQQFGLVFIAFRSFMMLTSREQQRACLLKAWEHLRPGGILALNVFDPQLDRMLPGLVPESWRTVGELPHPESYNRVLVEVSDRTNDTVMQVFEETWRFTEFASDGSVLRQEEEVLRMRWSNRNELRYLLELCGFEVEAEYSDYAKSPPTYGNEQIWVARKPAS